MPIGRVHAMYLFEVGDAIDVRAIPTLVDATAPAQLTTKPAAPPYLQYQQPPIVVDGAAIGVSAGGHRVRFTIYDYGVVSAVVTEPLPESWDDVIDLGQRWQDNPRMLADAERCCRALCGRISPAITAPRESYLWEDYVIFVITPSPRTPEPSEYPTALTTASGNAVSHSWAVPNQLEPLPPPVCGASALTAGAAPLLSHQLSP